MSTVTVQVDGSSASTTVTVSPPGTIVWKADGELPTNQEWAEYSTPTNCAVTSDTVFAADPNVFQQSAVKAQGANAYEFVLGDGETSCYGSRAELGQGLPERTGFSETRHFLEGDDRWISFQFMLGSDWNTNTSLWNGIGQIKQNVGAVVPYPMIGFNAFGGIIELVMEDGSSDTNPNHTKGFNLGNAITGHWYKYTLHIVFSINPNPGLIEVFGDPDGNGMRTLVPQQYTATLAADANGNPLPSNTRIGIYRHPSITGTAHLYYDGYTVATTRAAAEANAFR